MIPERRAAEVTPAVCKASAGAVEHLPVARVRNLADWLAEAKQAGAWVYGADAGRGCPTTQPDYAGRVVLVLGSEGRGLRPRVARACDELVALPLRGRSGRSTCPPPPRRWCTASCTLRRPLTGLHNFHTSRRRSG